MMESATSGPQAERSRRLATQTARVFPPTLHGTQSTSSTAVDYGSADRFGASKNAAFEATSTPNEPTHPVRRHDTKTALLAATQCVPTAACHTQIANLQDEKAFLTKYVERLLLQLRCVLQKHGELDKLKVMTDPAVGEAMGGSSDRESGEDSMAEKRLPPWMIASAVVHPLLQAYDVKIYELESAVRESKQAVDRMARHAESLAQSNSTLRQELEAAAEKAVLRMQHEPKETSGVGLYSDDPLNDSGGDYLGDLNERIDVLMSENSMLMEQVSLQDDELTGLKQQLSDREQQMLGMGQNFNQATAALQELRDACASLGDEKSRCEQQLQHYAARMAQLEGEKETISKYAGRLQSDGKSLESQLLEYEVLVENIKKNAESKDESFATRYQNVCARLRELMSVVEARDKSVDALEEKTRLLTSDLECARQDCEGMLQVMDSMDKQLAQYCGREDAVAELEQECKSKVEEMIIEKEQISARETQARREIARLLERIRSISDDHIKSHEDSVSQLTMRFDHELNHRESEIHDLGTELAQVRVKLDISSRNQRELEKNLADSMRRMKDAGEMYERKLKSLVERAAAAEEAKDTSMRTENDAILALRTKEDELAKMRNDYRDRTQELHDRVTSLERELEMRRTEAREWKEANEEINHKNQLLNDQLNKVKADCANRFASDFGAVHAENRDLKARAAELEYRLVASKKELTSAFDAQRNDRDRAEVRLVAEIEALKARVASLKEEKARVDRARQDAESRHAVVALQLQQFARDLADTKEALVERDHACDDSDRKVSELSAQLTIALSKQQQFFRQERELRGSIERATLEKTRLERDAQNCRKKLEEYRQADFLNMVPFPYAKPPPDKRRQDKQQQQQQQASNNQASASNDQYSQYHGSLG